MVVMQGQSSLDMHALSTRNRFAVPNVSSKLRRLRIWGKSVRLSPKLDCKICDLLKQHLAGGHCLRAAF
jgi:hypothetical protein